MSRVLSGVAVVMVLAHVLVLGVMHALPYDDGGMSAAFNDPGCDAPCFMGIQPGMTTFADALALLEAHPWVGSVEVDDNAAEWTWSGSQPDFLLIPPGDAAFTRLLSHNGTVTWIGFKTNAPTASFQMMFGTPSRSVATIWESYKPVGVHPYQSSERLINHQQRAQFDTEVLEIIAGVACPPTRLNMWDVPVSVSMPMQPIWSSFNQETVIETGFARLPRECR